MSDLSQVIERVQTATEGSRELDLAVHLALFPDGEIAGWMKCPRGLSGREGYSWDVIGSALIFEKWTADGRCPFNGGVPLPTYSISIDDALTLLPEGWWWSAGVCRRENHASVGSEIGTVEGELIFETFGATAPLALLAAILRARQAAQSGQDQTEARG